MCSIISAGHLAALRWAPVSSTAPTAGFLNVHWKGYIWTIESPCSGDLKVSNFVSLGKASRVLRSIVI